MKAILPVAILLTVGLAIGWPYIHSLSKEHISIVDPSHPEIRENRMVRPHYMSTDEKDQPFQVDAEWAKQKTENLADLVNPHGSITLEKGQTFNLEAKKGDYDSEAKILNLEENVTLTSTDGYDVKTEQARITIDNKIIEGDSYIAGEGPTGKIKGQGFKIEKRPGGNVITLKGRSQVVINKAAAKKHKAENEQ